MSQQWSTPSVSAGTSSVQNYMIPAILSTIFCCQPLGIVSIVFAAQVNSKVASGDIAGAMESSKKARMFMFIAIGGGVLFWICMIILWVFVIAVNA